MFIVPLPVARFFTCMLLITISTSLYSDSKSVKQNAQTQKSNTPISTIAPIPTPSATPAANSSLIPGSQPEIRLLKNIVKASWTILRLAYLGNFTLSIANFYQAGLRIKKAIIKDEADKKIVAQPIFPGLTIAGLVISSLYNDYFNTPLSHRRSKPITSKQREDDINTELRTIQTESAPVH